MKKILVLIFVAMVIVMYGEEKKVININTFEVSPYSNENWTGFDDLITKEAFRRIGYEVNFIKIEGTERSIQNVDAGMDWYIAKPFKTNEIKNIMNKL